MNKPCHIHFHDGDGPRETDLPERYQKNVTSTDAHGRVNSLLVQRAFLVDFAPTVLRTRVGGTKTESPIDFPFASVSCIEWFYGDEAPAPLHPEPHVKRSV